MQVVIVRRPDDVMRAVTPERAAELIAPEEGGDRRLALEDLRALGLVRMADGMVLYLLDVEGAEGTNRP